MYQSIAYFIRLAYIELGDKIKKFPKMLQTMVNFLDNESLENFSSEKYESHLTKKNIVIPLTMNDKAIKSFKEETSDFPEIYRAGLAGQEKFNFIYTLGQILTEITSVLDLYHLQDKNSIESSCDKLFKIWGSHTSMNGKALSQKFHNKNNQSSRDEIIDKMRKSINLIKKEIIPKMS